MVYRNYYNTERNYAGYTDWALSEFYRFKDIYANDSVVVQKNNSTGLPVDGDPAWDNARCYHWGFFTRGNDLDNSTESETAQRGVQPTLIYWQVLAFRLLLVLVFTYGVLLFTSFIAYLIPDVPGDVDEQEHREKYLTQQLVLQSVRHEPQAGGARSAGGLEPASGRDVGPVKRASKQQQLYPATPTLSAATAPAPEKLSQVQSRESPTSGPNTGAIGFVEPPAPGFVVS